MPKEPVDPVSVLSPTPPAAAPPIANAPQVINIAPAAPEAEPGEETSEYRWTKRAVQIVWSAAGVVVAAAVAAGAAHVIPVEEAAAIAAGAPAAAGTITGYLVKGYQQSRALRKQGTQG